MVFKHGDGDEGRHGCFCPVRLLIGFLALAMLGVVWLVLAPRPAAALITHQIHSVSVVSNPEAGNDGYYLTGETITVRIRWVDAQHVGPLQGDARMCEAQNAYLELDVGGTIRRALPSINFAAQTSQWGFIDFKYVVQTNDRDDDGFNIDKDALHGRYYACEAGGGSYNPYREGETGLPVHASGLDPHLRQREGLDRVIIGGGSRKVNGRYRPIFLDDVGRRLRTGPDLVFYKDAPVIAASGVNQATLPTARAGGFLHYQYEVSPSLPAGVRLSQPLITSPPVISGVPTVASPRTTYTLRTSNQRRAAELSFTLTVEESFHVTGVRITSRPRVRDVYAAGETIAVEVSFNRSAQMLGSVFLGLTIPLAALQVEVGSATRQFTYTSGNNTRKLVFSYTVQLNDIDTDGISVQRLVKVGAGGIVGVFPSNRTAPLGDTYYGLPGFTITNASGHKATGVPVTFGNRASIQYTFYQHVPVNVQLPGAISSGVGALTYTLARSFPRTVLTTIGTELTYTPPADGDAHGGTITGTPTRLLANDTYELTARDSRNVGDVYVFYLQVSSRAVLTGLSVTSSPGAVGYYTAGDVITVRANFNRNVVSFENAELDVVIGSRTRTLTATHDGSARAYVDFNYTVTAADRDTNGISIGGNALSGTFRYSTDASLPGALLTHAAVADQAGHKVRGTQTVPDFGSATVSDRTVTPVTLVTLTLPAATGGEVGLTYTLTPTRSDGQPDLPGGLSYSPPTNTTTGGVIAGRPAAAKGWTTYTLTATDGDGDEDMLTFALRSTDAQPSFSLTPDDRVYAVGWAVNESLPAATGGDGSLRYALTPALPAGLLFDRTTRVIGGTPTRVTAVRTYTLTSTDVDGDAATRTFTAEVRRAEVRVNPMNLSFAEGSSATYTVVMTTPPAGTVTITLESDNGDVTATPSPLTFTPGTWATRQTVTVRAVRDADGEADAATLSHAVNGYGTVTASNVTVAVSDADVPGVTVTPTSLNVTEGQSVTYTVVLATQPTGAVTISPSRTNGSTDVTVSSALTFTTTNWNTPQPVTVSAARDVGATGGRVATIGHAVNGYGTVTASNVMVTVIEDNVAGVTVTPTHLIVDEGSSALYTVVLATQPTGAVTVAPSRTSGSTDVTVSSALTFSTMDWSTAQTVTVSAGSDNDGEDDAATLSHAVSGYGTVISALPVAVTVDDDETLGVTVSPTNLTVVEGGSATYTVVLATQPTGTATVRVASDNGEVTVQSGSRAAAQNLSLTFSVSDYNAAQTVTVLAAEDDDADLDAATLSHAVSGYGTLTTADPVAVAVTENEMMRAPDFGAATVDHQDYRTGKAVTLSLPVATGGNGGLSYSLAGTLPAGLNFDATTRLLSGTPSTSQAAQTYTYTVHDSDVDTSASDAGTLTFSIGVETNVTPRFSGTVQAQRYKRGAAVGSPAMAYVELLAATGGNPPLTYSLQGPGGNDLPAGLTFEAATRRISGTPSLETAATVYTYAATDSDGDVATLDVIIRVVANQTVSFSTAAVEPQTYMQGSAISTLTLPEAQGGDGILVYALPNLPAGLTHTPPAPADHHGGTITGTPQAAQDAATYTLTATDADGDAATLDFTIAVSGDPMPDFSHARVPHQLYVTQKTTVNYSLPRARGGNAPLTYALTPARADGTPDLPVGLSYERNAAIPAGRIFGTPTAARGVATYTLTATDADADAATLAFTMEVQMDQSPAFPPGTVVPVPGAGYTQWKSIDPLVLPAATGGNGRLTYALPGLPKGLTYTQPGSAEDQGGAISGAPTEAGSFDLSLMVGDEDGDTASSAGFTIVVEPAPSFRVVQGPFSFEQYMEIPAQTLPAAMGGDSPLSYTMRELPAGLSYSSPDGAETHGGRITGIPVTVEIEGTYMLDVEDGDGDVANLPFVVTVLPNYPRFNRELKLEPRYVQNKEIVPLTFPYAGGSQPVTYRLSPELPAGLTYRPPEPVDRSGGVLTGTPTEALPKTAYTLTAEDRDGEMGEMDFTIEVMPDLVPTFGDAVVPAQNYSVATTITPLTLPEAKGGDGTLTYALTPTTLPQGLTFDADTRTLSGTPTRVQARTMYTWTAWDEDGDTARLPFTLEVTSSIYSRDLGLVLAGVGRTLAADAVEILGGRFSTPASRLQVTLGGQVLRLTEPQASAPSPLEREGRVLRGAVARRVPPTPSPLEGEGKVLRGTVARRVPPTPSPLEGEGRLLRGMVARRVPPTPSPLEGEGRLLRGTVARRGPSTPSPLEGEGRVLRGTVARRVPPTPFPLEGEGRVLRGTVAGRVPPTPSPLEGEGKVLRGPVARRVPSTPSPLEGEGRGEGSLPRGEEPLLPDTGSGSVRRDAVSNPSPWQRATGLAIGVARALGVALETPSSPSLSPPGSSQGEGILLQGEESIRAPFPPNALSRASPGQSLRFQTVSGKDLLARSAFELPLTRIGKDGVPAWTLWGRGSASGFSGQPEDDFRMDGRLYSGYLGLDYRPRSSLLLGLAVAHSTGDVEYERIGATKANVDVELMSVLPYAHWKPYAGLGVWGLLGMGWGDLGIKVVGDAQTWSTDLTSWLGAVGGRQALTTWQGIDLAAKTDAFLTTVRSEGKTHVPGARGHAERVRLLVEGRTAVGLSAGSRLEPRLELGGRWDSGTAEQGLGAELGGGVAYTRTDWGLRVEAQGRYLLLHEDGAFEDWGASVSVRLDPGAAGEGAYLTVSPVWGQAASGVAQLWGTASVLPQESSTSRPAAGWQPGSLGVDVGYGVALADGRGLVTPYGGLALARAGTSRYRLGSRVALSGLLDVTLEGERAEQPGQKPAHGVSVRLGWQW